jgi:hypothetical protein
MQCSCVELVHLDFLPVLVVIMMIFMFNFRGRSLVTRQGLTKVLRVSFPDYLLGRRQRQTTSLETLSYVGIYQLIAIYKCFKCGDFLIVGDCVSKSTIYEIEEDGCSLDVVNIKETTFFCTDTMLLRVFQAYRDLLAYPLAATILSRSCYHSTQMSRRPDRRPPLR